MVCSRSKGKDEGSSDRRECKELGRDMSDVWRMGVCVGWKEQALQGQGLW